MLKKFKHTLALSSLVIASLTFSTPSFSQVVGGTTEQILGEIRDKISEYLTEFKNYYGISIDGEYQAPIYFATPDLQALKDDLTKLDTYAQQPALAQGVKATGREMLQVITQPSNNRVCLTNSSCQNLSSVTVKQQNFANSNSFPLVFNQVGTSVVYKSDVAETLRSNFNDGNLPIMNSLLFDTLLNAHAYPATTSGKPVQKSYVELASGMLTPIRLPNFLPRQDPKAQDSGNGIDAYSQYIAELYTYISRRSVGTANLNQIVASRTKPDENTPSKNEVEFNLASRRMKGEWHDKMEQASPATVQREMLYALAEMNYQLYQMRMQNERLLATVSVFQLQSLDLSKAMIQVPDS